MNSRCYETFLLIVFFFFISFYAHLGLVSKPSSKVAKEGEMLGSQFYNGRVWSVWSNGTTLITPPPSFNTQLGAMATRYAQESKDHGGEN